MFGFLGSPTRPALAGSRLPLSVEHVEAASAGALLEAQDASLRQLIRDGSAKEPSPEWNTQKQTADMLIRSARVDGLKTKVAVYAFTYDNVDADILAEFLATVEGFKLNGTRHFHIQIIDPDTKNHEDGIVEKLHVEGWDRADATYAVAPGRFGVSTRTMMVLNAVSNKDRSLISTPIFHSSHTVETDAAKGWVRSDTVYMHLVEQEACGRCKLRVVMWLDMYGSVPTWITHGYLLKVFPEGLHVRLKAHLKANDMHFASRQSEVVAVF